MSGDSWTRPEDARSPRHRLKELRVFRDNGPGNWAAAWVRWDEGDKTGKWSLAMRWNGSDNTPRGNPTSRGHATWFIVPDEMACACVLHSVIPPPGEIRNV